MVLLVFHEQEIPMKQGKKHTYLSALKTHKNDSKCFFKNHKPTKRIVEEIIVDSDVSTIFFNGKQIEELEDRGKVGSL